MKQCKSVIETYELKLDRCKNIIETYENKSKKSQEQGVKLSITRNITDTKVESNGDQTYGAIARTNGLKFEQIVCDYYNDPLNKQILVDKLYTISKFAPDILFAEGYVDLVSSLKVDSIRRRKKTTSKSDLFFICRNEIIGISVKSYQ